MADPRIAIARHFLARFTVNGVVASDFADVLSSLDTWDDWCRAWSQRAAVHETLGRDALAAGFHKSAADHLARAAATYHFAKFLFVQDMAQLRAAHMKAVECLDLALPHMDPPGERVAVPYEGRSLAATLRKPKGVERPPVVIMTMGLDSSKEELVTFEQDFLDRGVAILAVDGPGQGEAEYELPIRPDYENVVGPIIDWVSERGDLDADRIAVWGISLGGYYAPRAAAFDKRIKACIANCGPFNWGALWSVLPPLTRAAYIKRSFSANADEAEKKAFELSMEGVAEKITCPMLVIAGGLDRLCPPEDARRLVVEASGPTELIFIPDGDHVAHNRFYMYRNQSADWLAKQLAAEV